MVVPKIIFYFFFTLRREREAYLEEETNVCVAVAYGSPCETNHYPFQRGTMSLPGARTLFQLQALVRAPFAAAQQTQTNGPELAEEGFIYKQKEGLSIFFHRFYIIIRYVR